jgi:hypothetical protein
VNHREKYDGDPCVCNFRGMGRRRGQRQAGGRSTQFRNGMYDMPSSCSSRRTSFGRHVFLSRRFSSLLVSLTLVVFMVGRTSTNLKPAVTPIDGEI